jgi:uncharacterized protein
MTENLLRFDAQKIQDEGGLSLDLELEPERVLGPEKDEAVPEGKLHLEAEFSVGGNSLLFQARLKGAWKLPCGRCLSEHRREYSCSVSETYPISVESIDITDVVRQAVLLELPLGSLCRPDCRGLCPKCGTDLNAGACSCKADAPSQFEALRKLKLLKEKNDAEPKT